MAPEDRRTWLDYFAAELRAWREYRGVTQEQLAKMINYSPSAVAMVETATRKPRPDFINPADEVLETGGALKRLYDELVSRELTPDWLDRWRKIEAEASALSYFEIFVIPGILQTPRYATAILQAGNLTVADIEAQVSARIARQKILTRERPPLVIAVIDQNALKRPIGGKEVMAEQLEHLIKMAELPNVAIHIVPEDVGAYAGLTGPFVIALLDGHETVYQDAALRGTCIDSPDDVAAFKRLWEALRSEALPRKASLDLIRKELERWKM